jgi:lipopolysaccharide/colanic/teichoic acid biosynthesis glycosyltransferase/GT2 family glycosyltransferase
MTTGAEVFDLRGLPLLTLAPRRAPAGPAWVAKRVLDYVAAGVGLLVLSPLLLLIAVLVKLDSRGPVFFRQKRVGRNGRPFEMWKFRSMVADAESRLGELQALNEATGPFFKMERDPRVTRVGRVLRLFCLDELPQLVNVLTGDMSLVGPRPCLATELAAQPELFDWRLPMLPGLTGLWQLAGRSWLPVEEGLRMDLAYLEHWSIWLDLQVILRTIVLAAGGAWRPSPVGIVDGPSLDRSRYLPLVDHDDLARAVACDVSIIVVAHESADQIARCLESTRLISDRVSYEVIVVDNDSRDGTADLVAAEFPDVRLLRKRGRHGFATNCNIGAVAAAGRRLLFLNPDAGLTPGSVEALAGHLDVSPEVGAVGPQLVYPDGMPQPSARRFPSVPATVIRRTPLRWALRHSAAERRHLMLDNPYGPSSSTDVDWLLGAALMVRTSVYHELSGMDDGFRLYCEDIDLCWRVHADGWRVALLPSATVVHDLSELTRRRFLTRATLWHFRSMARFVRLHGLGRPRTAVRQPVPVAPVIDLRPAAALSPVLMAVEGNATA